MKLIPNIDQAWKFWSIRLNSLVLLLAAADVSVLEGKVPAWLYGGLVALAIGARVIQQAKLKAESDAK